MNWPYKNWRDYQLAVATFFRERGCAADIEAHVQGARATHAIDVYVRFSQHGIDNRWVIECKLWKGRVEKSDVLTLRGVIDDIGANCGILFCENDFQSGAREAARHTNILLVTSFEDFKRTVQLKDRTSALLARASDEPGAPPVYAFSNGDEPHHILAIDKQLCIGNWKTGNISIIDPSTRSVASVIELDQYDLRPREGQRCGSIARYVPGRMACADSKLFVGQFFSDFVLAIDMPTKAIVKRIFLPGGGQGAITASGDGRTVFFASNSVNRLFIIDSATYKYDEVQFPEGGRGCLCVLRHPSRPLLYLGIQRGGRLNGKSYPGGNAFLATYDLSEQRYLNMLYLAEIENGQSDDACPICLTFDEEECCLYVGMFQSRRGICRVDEFGREIMSNIRFPPNEHNKHFPWADPLSQVLYRETLLSINRNNFELVALNRRTNRIERTEFLGLAPNGPHSIAVMGDEAFVSYPSRQGLIICGLAR